MEEENTVPPPAEVGAAEENAEPEEKVDAATDDVEPSNEESSSDPVEEKEPTETDEPEPDAEKDDGEPEEDSKKPAEPEPVSAGGRGRRERKAVQVYAPVEEEKAEKVIPVGKGEKLEDMPNVVAKFKAVTWSDPNLKVLYSLVFGVGKKKEFKAHLLQFGGLVIPMGKEDVERERLKQKLYKLKMDQIKAVMDLADIDRSAESFEKNPGKEDLCNRFVDWLFEPKASGKKLTPSMTKKATAKKRKSTGSASKGGSAKKAKKEAPARKTPAKVAPTKKTPAKKKSKAVELDIPGVDMEKVRAKVKSIVEGNDASQLTVKSVRKMLEDWLDTDLSDHKDAVRTIVMDAM